MSTDARPVDGDDPSSKVKFNPLVPKLVMELGGDREEFLAFAKPNQWALMQNAEAAKEKSGTANMAAMYRLAVTSVKPQDLARFEEYMATHGHEDDLVEQLGDALNNLWSGDTMLPLVPTSSDSSASTGPSGSTSGDGSSQPDTEVITDGAGNLIATVQTLPPLTPEEEEMLAGSSSPDYR
jgi:hypothetical protein